MKRTNKKINNYLTFTLYGVLLVSIGFNIYHICKKDTQPKPIEEIIRDSITLNIKTAYIDFPKQDKFIIKAIEMENKENEKK